MNKSTLLILCALVVTPALAHGIEPTFNGCQEMSDQAKVIVGIKDKLIPLSESWIECWISYASNLTSLGDYRKCTTNQSNTERNQ